MTDGDGQSIVFIQDADFAGKATVNISAKRGGLADHRAPGPYPRSRVIA